MNMIFNFVKSTDLRILILCLAAMLFLSYNSSAQAECTMACRGQINATLSPEDCSAQLSATDLMTSSCPGTMLIEILDGVEVIAYGYDQVTVFGAGIYTYRVTNSDGLPCWGNIAIEDKGGPIKNIQERSEGVTTVCGILLPDPSGNVDLKTEYVSCVVQEMGYSIEPWFDMLDERDFLDCSDDLVGVYNYTVVTNYCDLESAEQSYFGGPVGWEPHQVHTRFWYALDNQGNYSDTCSQKVITLKPSASRISLEPYRLEDCSDAAAIVTGPVFTDLVNGADFLTCPQTSGRQLYMEPGLYCGYLIDVKCNDKISICEADIDNVYKQTCNWTVIDWCSGFRLYDDFAQVLEVKDDTAPYLTKGTVDFISDPYDCEASLIAGPASFDEAVECSEIVGWETIIEYGEVSYLGGYFERLSFPTNGASASDIPAGAEVRVIWRATDGCGNIGETEMMFSARDQTAPVCIANDEIIVGLITNNASEHTLAARVYAEDIDDSSYDNCQEIELLIRRHDQKLAYIQQGKDIEELWAPYVEFTEKDLKAGSCEATYKVELLVSEKRRSGLTTECFGLVTIENKTIPIAKAPADIHVDCKDHIPGFGNVELWGGCNKDVEVETETIIDDKCAYDIIYLAKRTWTPFTIADGTKHYGIPVTQTISVSNVHDIKMEFPIDLEIDCNADGTIPAPLTLDDILTDYGCGQWKMNVEDKYYTNSDEVACNKIIREYEFINWCTWEYDRTGLALINRPDELILDEAEKVFLRYRDDNGDGYNDIADSDPEDMDIYDQYINGYPSLKGSSDNKSGEDASGAFVLIGSHERFDDLHTFSGIDGINGGSVNYVDGYKYGRFIYRQIIKINDETAPELSGGIDAVTCDPTASSCRIVGDVVATFTTMDNCSDVELSYQLEVDGSEKLVNDPYGKLVDGTITGRYPTGTHAYVVTARDGCNNITSKRYEFTVGEECKKPTPVCLATFTALMENGMVEIWASDIESGSSYDNCTDYEDLDFAVQRIVDVNMDGQITSVDIQDEMPTDKVVTLTCADVVFGKVYIALWARDEAGNTQFCLTPIYVTDNNKDCPEIADVQAQVSGAITNESDDEIDNVMIKLNGSDISSTEAMIDGLFSFSVPMNRNVTVAPEKNDNHTNGVSTADLVALQRHILGINPLNSAYKLIAADATNDSKVDTRDMLHVSRLILGLYAELPNNASWRFVDKQQEFVDPSSPWGFAEAINLNTLSVEEQADFIGIKIGDVTGNAIANNLLGDDATIGTLDIAIQDDKVVAGEITEIAFRASDFNGITGYQFTINVDAEIIEVTPGLLPNMSEANFGQQNIHEGIVTTSWAHAQALNVDDNEVLFKLFVRADKAVNVSELIEINSSITAAEAYDNDLSVMNVRPAFSRVGAPAFSLYQNAPNPFNGTTTIGFELPTNDHVTLKVMDVSGKTLKVIDGDFEKGYNSIALSSDGLMTTGVMYYEVTTSAASMTKKMIVLNK